MSTQATEWELLPAMAAASGMDARGIERFLEERLIGVSAWAIETRATIAAYAGHDRPVLVRGEPGTGRELIARLIHECSPRRTAPFAAIPGASFHDSVSPAECDAETQAFEGRPTPLWDWLQPIRGGTLYVQEYSGTCVRGQRSGAGAPGPAGPQRVAEMLRRTFDLRLVLGLTGSRDPSITRNFEPAESVRLLDTIFVPPLRVRRCDVEALAHYFVSECCRRTGKEPRELAPDTLIAMRAYAWPGHVTELREIVEETIRRSKPPRVDPSALPGHMTRSNELQKLPGCGMKLNLNDELNKIEHGFLTAALHEAGGVQRRAARLLGVKMSTLHAKIKKHGIDARKFKS